MRIYLDTLGCRLNFGEMESLAQQMARAGHRIVHAPEQADVCVINTCAVTSEAARKSRQLVRQAARANESARLAVTGCYATLEPETTAALPNVQLVADNSQKDMLAALLEPWSAEIDAETVQRMQPDAAPFSRSRTRAFLKVQDGCNNRCTFCIVTVARGQECSRPSPELVREVRALTRMGYQEVVLTGVHLGSYGRDLGQNLHALVAGLLEQTDIPRLRLSSLEPWDLSPDFFNLWAQSDGRLCPHLHLPLQAGCDRTLQRMARRCTTATFARLVEAARSRIPDLTVTTDIIVGFPGESKVDFEESAAYCEAMQFAHIHIFPFSPREGTAASRFKGQLSRRERKRRSAVLHEIAARSARAERERFLGQVRPVLWEGEGRELTDRAGKVWSGLSDNYLRVLTVAPPYVDLNNRITPVRLSRLENDALWGEDE